ncbi:hypothetical protein GCM10027169_08920 [Gordonia jinhuaensis]|uniref:Uncharacterized protein n=1 Tax=Gordonia jinhuaensis TaxID=1517702 RepID=A0A916X0D8_9ACTN|nr:hypothetical protein [Gordonia jinhuaensis]GGB44933.1 hypothetical protein GCM10011489_35470 [Gordonia jinhuaensis]
MRVTALARLRRAIVGGLAASTIAAAGLLSAQAPASADTLSVEITTPSGYSVPTSLADPTSGLSDITSAFSPIYYVLGYFDSLYNHRYGDQCSYVVQAKVDAKGAANPVTFTVHKDGGGTRVLGQSTPSGNLATIHWTPGAPGIYTINASQGDQGIDSPNVTAQVGTGVPIPSTAADIPFNGTCFVALPNHPWW